MAHQSRSYGVLWKCHGSHDISWVSMGSHELPWAFMASPCVFMAPTAIARHEIGTDGHYSTFWRRSAAMTAELPWTSVGVATGYRGDPRVSTASATAHGTSTANATVVSTARAAVLSVANSVAPTMVTRGSPWQFPRQFARKFPRQVPRTFHGYPRPSAAIATAILR